MGTTTRNTALTRRGFVGSAALGALGAAALAAPARAAASLQAAAPKQTLSPAETANKRIVDDFCAAWKTGDAVKVGANLAADCVVRFTASTDGSPAITGQAAVVAQVAKYLTGSTIEFIIEDTWASGPMVVNRRVDRIVSPRGKQDIHVVGVFFIRQGKIREWSDFIVEAV